MSAFLRKKPGEEFACLKRIAEGDRYAFEGLYRTYRKRVFRYLLRLVDDTAVAEELTNDVLVEVWRSAPCFDGRSKPSTWIFGIARHKALNALRRKHLPVKAFCEAMDRPDTNEDPETRAISQCLCGKIKQALQALSLPHREVIELAVYQGFSYAEIARAKACSVNTVKTRMYYARRHLRQILKKMGVAIEPFASSL